jgi:hypothetical protein
MEHRMGSLFYTYSIPAVFPKRVPESITDIDTTTVKQANKILPLCFSSLLSVLSLREIVPCSRQESELLILTLNVQSMHVPRFWQLCNLGGFNRYSVSATSSFYLNTMGKHLL